MLGIDLSKETLTGALVAAADRRLCWEITVPTTAHGIAQLIRRTPPSDARVVEPTGIDRRRVGQQADAAGRQVLLAQPQRAKTFLAAVQPRAKTDARTVGDWRCLVSRQRYAPFRSRVRRGNGSSSDSPHVKGSAAVSPDSVSNGAVLPYAAGPLTAVIEAREAQQTTVDRQLSEARIVLPVVTALREMPGIGPVTATAVAVSLTTKSFEHPDQFVASIGLDTRVRDSGQHDEREKAKGLTTGAFCAVARKLARTCWSLTAHGRRYEATRVHHQPMSGTPRRNLEESKTP